MNFKLILLLVISMVSACDMMGQEKNDSTKYRRPDIGYSFTFPLYWDCADGIRAEPYIYMSDLLLSWKPAVDSFIWLVEVHSDCRSSSLYNSMYTQRKADSIVAFMKRESHDSMMITSKGMGESQLVNNCTCEGENRVPCTEEQHQANRRIVFKIIGRKEF